MVYAEAHWDYITLDPDELAFKAGDVIEVHDCSDRHWWYGAHQRSRGWFMAAFVRVRAAVGGTARRGRGNWRHSRVLTAGGGGQLGWLRT